MISLSHSAGGGSECSSSPASPNEDITIASQQYFTTTTPPSETVGEQQASSPPPPQFASSTSTTATEHPLSPTLPSLEDSNPDGGIELVVNIGDTFPMGGGGVEGWGSCLSVGDVDNIRQFFGSFVRGALVPHVERQVASYSVCWWELTYSYCSRYIVY